MERNTRQGHCARSVWLLVYAGCVEDILIRALSWGFVNAQNAKQRIYFVLSIA